uniref:Photosystem II reaction centre X protein containing protein, expressed n=1 Tax=Oryza sativa subsp. japonica TaxID=39947 RepID=Q10LL6_ORYSJ|nr:Photosystem II reaction centre X protein containing protein, expressed [Oryza sativa Japonica Group]
MAATATAVAASLSVAGGLGRPLARVSSPAAPMKAASPAAARRAVVVAEAAPALSPSLKNFLLSIASGGVVLVAIVGAVVAVSNFDPVKRT